MRIGIDCRLWRETGIGRYTKNLVLTLEKIDHENEYFLFARSEDKKEITTKSSNFKLVDTDIPWHSVREQINFPKILNEQKLDLMHFTYFSIPLLYRRAYVVTVHDLIVNKINTGKASTLPYPVYFAKRMGYKLVLSNAVARARKIIVPSNTVRDDLLKTYTGISPDKIAVTYEGGFAENSKPKTPSGSEPSGRRQNEKPKIDGKYLLRVGNFYPHKNVERLLLAFKEFLYDNYDNHSLKLVLVGKRDHFFGKIERQINILNISDNVVLIENVSDSDLMSLYKNAVAILVPSLMEGFSLTAVEGMSMGIPVIVSDIPVHREICANAAVYCNPQDINDIKQKINFVCSLTAVSRKELVDQGIKQAKKFSWTKMAQDTLKLYKSTAAQASR